MTGDAWRLFIAVELPEDTLRGIGRLQDKLKSAIGGRAARWTRPEGIHLTLKFLGDVAPGRAAEIEAGMKAAAATAQPFELRARGLGCFPNLERPRVLWVGLAGEVEALRALQGGVEERIAPMGFPTEERGFSPHLTLARTAQGATRDEAAAIGMAAKTHATFELGAWQVTEINLMRSQLKADGALYTRVGGAALGY